MEIQIKVNWKKNRTWGLNPHASFYAFDGLYKGTASGCGFDKLSSAVAHALNQCVPLSLALLRNEESLKGVYGIRFFDHTSKKTGKTSRAVLWEGGVGINCFHQVIEKLGGTFKHVSDKTWDYIEWTLPDSLFSVQEEQVAQKA